MALLLLLLLDSGPVSAAQAILDDLHTYDIVSEEVDATPTANGLEVDLRLTLRTGPPGPLRFLLSAAVEELQVTFGDREVEATLGDLGIGKLLEIAHVPPGKVPALLTLAPDPPLAAGTEATFRLRYRWRPPPGGWFRAGARDVETHLSSFWLPAMADEVFAATVRVKTDAVAFAPGDAQRTADGWVFTSPSAQVVPLFVADLERFEGKACEVFLPHGQAGDGEAIAADLAQVLRSLEGRLGVPGKGPFRLVVSPEKGVPSYCGGSFAILKSRPRDRAAWLALLAHECAHRWFGYRLKTPVVGRGGTWLREGLAEWAGVETAGEILGGDAARDLWSDRFRWYVSRVDLRRASDGVLFANEPTLLDATYVDDPAVPYERGALVLRLLARERPGFVQALRGLMEGGPGGIVGAREVLEATGGERTAAYYAATTRLPDLELRDVAFLERALTARIVCNDPRWPGGLVPVRIGTEKGPALVDVEVREGEGRLAWEGGSRPLSIEIDPDRLYLDPVRSNSIRER